jgi:predicted kinase
VLYGLAVPRLVLINGAPGSGKSTLARRYVNEHPLTLALDIDVVRSMLGGWLDQPRQAGLLARRLALAMAEAQLSSGRDVVMPQFLGRLDFVLDLERLCADVGAEFIEVALLSNADDAAWRFTRRSEDPQSQGHRDAAALLERGGGVDGLPQMYARLLDVVAKRPATRIVVTVDGEIEHAYRQLVGHVEDATSLGPNPDR